MFDLNKLRIKGSPEQERSVVQAARAVERYSDPAIVKKLHEKTTCFVFSDIKNKRVGGYYLRVQGQDVVVLPKGKFEKRSLKDRHETLCHELAHADWREKQNNKFQINSKENEAQAFQRGSLSVQKFEENNELTPLLQKTLKFMGVTSQRSSKEIKKFLDKEHLYRCLPDKEPRSLFEKKIAIENKESCEEDFKALEAVKLQ